jgi:parvulin-like peptidyl-prolyl isomerase
MEMKTRLPFLLLLSLPLVALLAACGGGGSSSVSNDAIATVNGTPVSKATFNGLMIVACARYKAQGQACPKVGTPNYTQLRSQAVTFLVQEEELQQQAKKLGVSVTQQDVNKQIDEITKTYYKGSKAQFLAALKKDDISLDQLVTYNLRPNLLSQKLQAKVTSSVNVSEAAAQKYYGQNKAAFKTPETREVRHILVKNKSLAENIETQLKNGASFAVLAKKYSKDPGSAATGGKLCVAHGGSSATCHQTVAPFDKAAFALKTNQLGLVHSVYGWHVLQPVSAIHPAHVQTFKEVEQQIQANLSQQQKQLAWQNWLQKMAKDYKSKVSYQSGYEPATTVTPPAQTVPTTTG